MVGLFRGAILHEKVGAAGTGDAMGRDEVGGDCSRAEEDHGRGGGSGEEVGDGGNGRGVKEGEEGKKVKYILDREMNISIGIRASRSYKRDEFYKPGIPARFARGEMTTGRGISSLNLRGEPPISRSLNWQHQLYKNPKPNPDIKTLFVDHTCGQPNGARAPSPANTPLLGSIPKPGGFPPLGAHGPFQSTPAPVPTPLAGWMSNPPPVTHPAISSGHIGLDARSNLDIIRSWCSYNEIIDQQPCKVHWSERLWVECSWKGTLINANNQREPKILED